MTKSRKARRVQLTTSRYLYITLPGGTALQRDLSMQEVNIPKSSKPQNGMWTSHGRIKSRNLTHQLWVDRKRSPLRTTTPWHLSLCPDPIKRSTAVFRKQKFITISSKTSKDLH